MALELLLKQIDTHQPNADIIRENFKRIQQYLLDIGADKILKMQTYIQNNLPSVSQFDRSESFLVTILNQTSFTLTDAPVNPSTSSAMYINGCKMTYGDHYTIAGKVVTFYPITAGFQLEVVNEFGQADRVIVFYMVS